MNETDVFVQFGQLDFPAWLTEYLTEYLRATVLDSIRKIEQKDDDIRPPWRAAVTFWLVSSQLTLRIFG